MKKIYTKPTVEILHAQTAILAGSTQDAPQLPLDPDIEDEGYGD